MTMIALKSIVLRCNMQFSPSMAYLRSPRLFSVLSSRQLHRSTSLFCSSSTRFFSTKPAKSVASQSASSSFFPTQPAKASANPSSAPNSLQGAGTVGSLPPRVFVSHSIYKGKAALNVTPKAPEFTSLDSGSFKLSKEGCVFFTFAPASGIHQYDWHKKQVFSLSVAEIGTLITLGSKGSCEFFHDPFIRQSNEGKVRKTLKVEPFPDGSGHFFNFTVHNKLLSLEASMFLPVTKSEFAVLASALNFILPHLIGWHAFTDTIKPHSQGWLGNAIPKSSAKFEWDK